MLNSLDARQRDFFPLPRPDGSPKLDSDSWDALSRSKQRRIAKHHKIDSWYADAVCGLNSLFGSGSIESDAIRNLPQTLVLDRIRRRYESIPAPPADMSAAGAFHSLRGTASGYSPEVGQGARVPFSLELCSMPPPLSSAAPVLESLDGVPFQRVRDWRSCILRSEDEQRAYLESAARVKPYLDPGLVRDPAIYAIF